MRVSALLLVLLVVAVACTPPAAAPAASIQPVNLSAAFDSAVEREAVEPLAADGYLDTVRAALSRPDDVLALAALDASLDALLWRQTEAFGPNLPHALVHRSRAGAVKIAEQLRAAYLASAPSGSTAPPSQLVWMRMFLAAGLHSLALRIGDIDAARRWSERAGCVPRATLVGPLAVNPLMALRQPSPLQPAAPFPSSFAGVPPFASQPSAQVSYADACALRVGESSPLAGLHLAAVDIDNPRAQRLHFAISSEAASRVDLGGKQLLVRAHSQGGQATTSLASAAAPAGKLRLVIRVARSYGHVPVSVHVLDERGEPLSSQPPRAGAVAPAVPSAVQPLELSPRAAGAAPSALAVAAALARGDTRSANALAESAAAPKPGDGSLAFDLLRVRALQAAQDAARNQRKLRLEGLAEQLLKRCEQCWEARLAASEAVKSRQGYGAGAFAAWQRLGMTSADRSWPDKLGVMEVLWLALDAHSQGQPDIARTAYDALAVRLAGSFLLADLDDALHARIGMDEVQAACQGGTSRASGRCVGALLSNGDMRAAQREMGRLRQLRGDPALLRAREVFELLTRQRRAEALDIYLALSPGERAAATLGAWYGEPASKQKVTSLLRDATTVARDAPYGLQPLARLLGQVTDRSADFEKHGAQLVARDRAEAFLPGAGTAVLEHTESYDLEQTGLLHYWLYDLRRVSGTTDVADGTWSGVPMVDGRSSPRTLRRRIYKKDGSIIDPDSRAGGSQGQTDLSQLQAGDYVEVVLEGWGLPGENGQLVVDTADMMPLRTSVRHAEIRFRRPRDLKLSLWTHTRLGKGESSEDKGTLSTVWTLREQPPRTIEEGVPPLESRLAISFGTDSYARIGKSFGEQLRSLDEDDPYVARWVQNAVKGANTPREKVNRLVEAVGKLIVRGDNFLLSDTGASMVGGSQRSTARTMLERADGSRSWIIHRGLRELSIASTIAIAETQPFSSAPGFPARPGRFSHALVKASIDGEDVWIDADIDGPPLPPGRISPELSGRQALLPDGNIVTVTADMQLDVDDIELALVMKSNGDATGRFKALIHGRPAQQVSEALETVVGDNRTAMLRNVVLGWLPWADVRSVALGEGSSSWQLTIVAEVAVVGLAQPQERDGKLHTISGLEAMHFIHPRAQATSLASVYAQRATRSTPLAINQPMFYRLKRSIELPAGAKLVRVPKDTKVEHASIVAERRVSATDMRIDEVFSLNMPIGTIEPDAYPRFVTQLRSIDDAFLYSIGLELAEAK